MSNQNKELQEDSLTNLPDLLTLSWPFLRFPPTKVDCIDLFETCFESFFGCMDCRLYQINEFSFSQCFRKLTLFSISPV